MPTLKIDNQTITVPEGATVLEAAEKLGIMVPHFCYHKELGAVGACRMCAVTIHEGSFKGLKMSCLIDAEDGMVVTTDDEQSRNFREHVGEWLMINHPHDCPVCDEGGECQLQEMTIGSGHDVRRYDGPKRTYHNQDLGPFIYQEMNRCIQCYRCVRTYRDYCGGRDFGVLGSRNRLFFGPFKDGMLESDFSGNIVDVCPTGVFTDRTFRFKSRYWDLQEAPSVCPHCSLGCATVPGARLRELQRIRSGENMSVNGGFICDRGRFGSGYVNHPERPRRARAGDRMISAVEAVKKLQTEARRTIREHGSEAVVIVGSGRSSVETNWLLQSWAAELGCSAPWPGAHRQRHRSARIAAFDLSDRLASLQQVRDSDMVLVVGADPLAEAPMLAVALRQAVRKGGQVFVYDPRPIELPFAFDLQTLDPLELCQFILDGGEEGAHMRDLLSSAERPLLIGGELLGAEGLQLLNKLSLMLSHEQRPCLVHPLLGSPNSFGCALLSQPDQDDLLTRLESGRVKMLVCFENDPLEEAPEKDRFEAALTQLEQLVVCDYLPTSLGRHADLFIPTRTILESDGTFINNEGRLRRFVKVMDPGVPLANETGGDHPPRTFSKETPGDEPLPATLMLQRLLDDTTDFNELQQRLEKEFPRLQGLSSLKPEDAGVRVPEAVDTDPVVAELPEQPAGAMHLLIGQARYGSDLCSRYSDKLKPRFSEEAVVMLNPDDAQELQVQAGERLTIDTESGSVTLPVQPLEGLARGCVLVENSALLPQFVPGAGLRFCQVGREVIHG